MAYYSLTVLYYLATYMMGSFTILPRGLRMHFETETPVSEITITLQKANPKAVAKWNFLFLKLP